MKFSKNRDEILQDIILDYTTTDPSIDLSVGSIARIKAEVLASALWGIYRYQDWIYKQRTPLVGDPETIEEWASLLGLTTTVGESVDALQERVLGAMRYKIRGGTAADYEFWAKTVHGDSFGNEVSIIHAKCYPADMGAGTVKLVVACSNPLEVTPTWMINAIRSVVSVSKPVGFPIDNVLITAATIQLVSITGVVSGSNVDIPRMQTSIQNYVNGLGIDQLLYLTQLQLIAGDCGAESFSISAPTGDVVGSIGSVIRLNVLSIS
jgi:uncharacterized phage protein gp47/JayE